MRRAPLLVLASAAALACWSVDAATQGLPAAQAPGQTDASDRGQAPSHDGTAPPAAEQSEKATPAVDLAVVYTAELWRNQQGGLRRGWRYLDNLDLTLTVDAERALGWHGATLFVYGLYNNGHAFSGDLVGDAQTVSNIETGVRAARLYEAWIEQRFAGDRGSVKVGLYDLNSEFDTSDVGSLSLLSSHGIGPEFGQSGRNGPSIFPVTSLAVRGEYKLSGHWVLRAAALDGVPGDPEHPGRTAIKLSGRDGALLVGEVNYVGRDSKVALGYWRYTARFPTFAPDAITGSDREARGNDGVYLVAEHRLTHVGAHDDADDKRGLSAFAQAGFADGQFNRIDNYVGAGLVYTGVLRPKGEDRAGITLARAAFARPYRRRVAAEGTPSNRAESVIQLTYRTPLNRWLTVQPDLQYVTNPGGAPAVKDALALGLRVELGF